MERSGISRTDGSARHWAFVLIVGLALALVTACAEHAIAPEPEPIFLDIVSGDGQEGQAAMQLAEPLGVRVMGADSIPREGVPVVWLKLGSGGVVEPVNVRSSTDGLVEAQWTLGGGWGPQEATATVDGEAVTFGAWATPPPPNNWADVLLVEASAYVAAGAIVAEFTVTNLWVGTVELMTNIGCFAFPSLWTESGDLVAAMGFAFGCTQAVRRTWLGHGESLSRSYTQSTAELAPGTYMVRIRFKLVEVNGRPTTLPTFEGTVVVEG